jgi:hypothetical protein
LNSALENAKNDRLRTFRPIPRGELIGKNRLARIY